MTEKIDDEDLDLTAESSSAAAGEQAFDEKPYDGRPQEDTARRYIAYALVALLAFVVAWALLSVTFCWCCKSDDVVKILQIVLTPIITLVSAATGFYYGSKSIGVKAP